MKFVINISLSVTLALLAIFILLEPFYQELTYSIETDRVEDLEKLVTENNDSRDKTLKDFDIPKDSNSLIIPKIGVAGEINESVNSSALDLGIWRRPKTSSPDIGGNTVFVAHRFLYTSGPNTFYHLDKLDMDDNIYVFWNDEKLSYKVTEIKTVHASEVEIEDNTTEAIITLYTCTGFRAENRLVIRATLYETD